MALDQSALPDILEVLKTAEVDNRIRQEAETIYQALIEAQLTPVIVRWDLESSLAAEDTRKT